MLDVLIDGLVVGLVSYKIWRTIALDLISASVRNKMGELTLDFVSCAHCLGFWLSLATTSFIHLVWGTSNPVLVAVVASVIVGFLGNRE